MEIRCANCSAKITLERDDPFLKCPFCDSTLFLDRAQTFKRFQLPPSVSEARARSVLADELGRREMPRLPILQVKGLLLPFWGVRGKESGDTFPAFSPLPAALHGFRLPPAGALRFGRASGRLRAHTLLGQHLRPLAEPSRRRRVRVSTSFRSSGSASGQEKASYTAWLDAVVGSVHLEQTPPPLSGRITRRFWWALTLLFLSVRRGGFHAGRLDRTGRRGGYGGGLLPRTEGIPREGGIMSAPRALACPSCGGAVAPPLGARKTHCSYCGKDLFYTGEDFLPCLVLSPGVPDGDLHRTSLKLFKSPWLPSGLRKKGASSPEASYLHSLLSSDREARRRAGDGPGTHQNPPSAVHDSGQDGGVVGRRGILWVPVQPARCRRRRRQQGHSRRFPLSLPCRLPGIVGLLRRGPEGRGHGQS